MGRRLRLWLAAIACWGAAGYWGPGRRTYTRQLYIRRVEIDIYRGSTYDTPKRDRVFEGRALSAGQNGQLEPVMPYILDALFKDFPGRSGEPMHVAIEVPPGIADKMPHAQVGQSSRTKPKRTVTALGKTRPVFTGRVFCLRPIRASLLRDDLLQ